VWRLVLGRYATLQEIESHWSLDDLIRANIALTFQQKLEAQQAKSLAKLGKN